MERLCIRCLARNKKKLKFARKYLKGRGINPSKRNVDTVLNYMDAEGVVFD